MNWGERAKAIGKFVLVNIDAFVVVALALLVLGMEATGDPARDLVDSAILALLGITAVVLLRDRHGRSRVDEIAAFVEDQRSDRPYQVQSELNRWEIDDGGRAARFTKTQRLVFTRNEICTMEHWCTAAVGHVDLCQAEWRLDERKPWIGATTIHDFGINSGRNYIFSLDTERSRGDALHWRVTRLLRDRFPSPQESVSLRPQAPIQKQTMLVIWPLDREPTQVEIRHENGASRPITPQRRKDGRLFVEEQLASNVAGSATKIEWTW